MYLNVIYWQLILWCTVHCMRANLVFIFFILCTCTVIYKCITKGMKEMWWFYSVAVHLSRTCQINMCYNILMSVCNICNFQRIFKIVKVIYCYSWSRLLTDNLPNNPLLNSCRRILCLCIFYTCINLMTKKLNEIW